MSSLKRICATSCALVLTLGACDDDHAFTTAETAQCRSVRGGTARWLIAADDSGRRFLDAYCVGVGPALLQRGQTQPAAAPDTFVVVNWNMALGEGELRRLVADLRGGRITGSPVTHYALLLQEAPRLGPEVPAAETLPQHAKVSELDAFGATDIATFAREHGLHLLYAPSMRNGTDALEDQGNAILATLPLSDAHIYELPAGIRRRVAVSAAVHWPRGERLRLVSAHLDNWSPRRLLGSLGGVRARQARGLATMMPREGALLLGGDLNTWTRGTAESAYRTLRSLLPRPDTIDARPTADRLLRGRKLDYLLLRAPQTWHFVERRIDRRYGSDHNPIVGILQLQQ